MNNVGTSPTLAERIEDREVMLEVQGITKRFPGILANDNVNLKLHRGEILALLGENGAGKSTLMNIIYGLYHQDEGSIRLKGEAVKFASPREAIHSGIGMVHQHFQLIPVMTVAENVLLGEEGSVTPTGEIKTQIPPDETKIAGTLRLAWGWIWRLGLPLVAILIGWTVGFLLHLLTLNIGTYLAQDPLFEQSTFQRLELEQRATQVLTLYYPGHETAVQVLLWSPLIFAALAGAAVTVAMYRYARSTWRGRARETTNKALIDSIMDGAINLAATIGQSRNPVDARNQVRLISQRFNLEVDPDALIEKLPVGMQQRVEIVKALYRKADILILDEPTAVLTPQEGKELFKIMKQLAAQGVSIIFITHKLKEVLEVADSIVVMRGGKVVGTAKPKDSTPNTLAALMVGREVMLKVDKTESKPRDVILEVINLVAADNRGQVAVDHLNLEVRSGEILGIAGVQGNGQTELVEVLTGLRPSTAGTFRINGVELENRDPRQVTLSGTGHVPEDRHRFGMVDTFSVGDNLVLNQYFVQPYSGYPSGKQLPFAVALYTAIFLGLSALWAALWINVLNPVLFTLIVPVRADLTERELRRLAAREPATFILSLIVTVVVTLLALWIINQLTQRIMALIASQLSKSSTEHDGFIRSDASIEHNASGLIKEFDIRTPGASVNGGTLSGGNQQKMVVAREFSRRPSFLIAAQPTRGIDVGSIEFIHQRIVQQRDAGAAVLLVSAELDEIMALSDRIAVMYKGKIVDILPADRANRETLGLLMAGSRPTDPVTEGGAASAVAVG
jgi:ABC-type uncharacterized transport system ATPase subunit